MWSSVVVKTQKGEFKAMINDLSIVETRLDSGIVAGSVITIDDDEYDVITVITDSRGERLIAEVEEVDNEQVSRRVGDSTKQPDVSDKTDT